MSEKKTFKNAVLTSDSAGATVYGWTVPGGYAVADVYPREEWNMEVTFTRKPRPIRVGDRVKHANQFAVGTVLALYFDPSNWADGNWAWVQWGEGITPASSPLRKLTRTED